MSPLPYPCPPAQTPPRPPPNAATPRPLHRPCSRAVSPADDHPSYRYTNRVLDVRAKEQEEQGVAGTVKARPRMLQPLRLRTLHLLGVLYLSPPVLALC